MACEVQVLMASKTNPMCTHMKKTHVQTQSFKRRLPSWELTCSVPSQFGTFNDEFPLFEGGMACKHQWHHYWHLRDPSLSPIPAIDGWCHRCNKPLANLWTWNLSSVDGDGFIDSWSAPIYWKNRHIVSVIWFPGFWKWNSCTVYTVAFFRNTLPIYRPI